MTYPIPHLSGLEIPASYIAGSMSRCSIAFSTLADALAADDYIRAREAADTIRNEASRMQALAAVVSRHIADRKSRRARKV